MTHWQTNAWGEAWLPAINGNAFAHRPSRLVFRETYRDTFERGDHLYCVVGSDSGLLAQFILQETDLAEDNKRFVFIEKDAETLARIFERYPDLQDHEHIQWETPAHFSFDRLSDQWPEYLLYSRYSLVRSLAVLDRIDPAYTALWEEIAVQQKLFGFQTGALFSTKKFIDTQLFNVPLNMLPAARLEGTLQGRSVLLLGGGPSLDRGIDWIRAHRDRILIAAVGRIARRLQQEGITPDFYASVDPNDVSYDNAKWLTRDETPVLIHTHHAHPSLLAEYRGPMCFTDARYPWPGEETPPNLLTSGPTVVNTLMTVLVMMGAARIYLLGVDFCFGSDGRTHESGSLEASKGRLAHGFDLTVETYAGERALTDQAFYDAAQMAQTYASEVHRKLATRFFQLSPQAARLEAVPLIDFRDIRLNPAADQQATLRDIHQRLQVSRDERIAFLDRQRNHLRRKRRTFRHIRRLARIGRDTARALFHDLDQLDAQTRRITRIKARLDDASLGWAHAFLYSYAVGNYARFLKPGGTGEQRREEIRETLDNYFTALHRTCDMLLDTLDDALHHVDVHLEEAHGASLTTLAPFWLHHRMEGRIFVWYRQGHAPQREEERTLAQRLEQLYEDKLHDEDTALARRLARQTRDLKRHLRTAQDYFDQRNRAGLEKIATATADQTDPRQQALHHLVSGYLLELQQQPQAALTHYLQVEDPEVTPYAATRIVQVAFEQDNLPLAMEALGLLTRYDDRYFVAYADLLASTGDLAGAVQIYDHYLSRHLDDHAVWLKAGKAALAAGDWTAARQCFEEVITGTDETTLQQEARILYQQIPQARTA